MKLEPFLLERWMSSYQFSTPPIEFDLASSTGPKWTVREVLEIGGEEAKARLDELELSYAPANGGCELREAIADCHGSDAERVVVTTGASEAISILLCLSAEPGSNVVLPSLIFPAIPVQAGAWGHEVRTYSLTREDGFEHRADRILNQVDESTKLVFVNSPHNPTGAVIARRELAKLAESLADRGIILVVDEVYHPLYYGTPGETAAGLPNTVVVGDLSKAYSLSGLRIGWVIDGDEKRRHEIIDARGYFTISNSIATELLAAVALGGRCRLLDRLERVARSNLTALFAFMQAHADVLDWIPPLGGTTCFPWVKDSQSSRPLCEALAAGGVLTIPGECFDAPSHFRIGFGTQASGFSKALEIFAEVLEAGRWR